MMNGNGNDFDSFFFWMVHKQWVVRIVVEAKGSVYISFLSFFPFEGRCVYPAECLILFDVIRKYFHNRLMKIYIRIRVEMECVRHPLFDTIVQTIHSIAESILIVFVMHIDWLWVLSTCFSFCSGLYSTTIGIHWFIYMHTNDFQLDDSTASPAQPIVNIKLQFICVRSVLLFAVCFWTTKMISTIFAICFSFEINPLYKICDVHLAFVHICKYIHKLRKPPNKMEPTTAIV